ncbi:hypothetical protein D3C71_1777080 [compost metagenome]
MAIGSDGDHVIDLACGLAVVLQRAGAAGFIPDVFGCAKPVAHIGFGGDAFFEFADALRVAGTEGEQGNKGDGHTCGRTIVQGHGGSR